MSSYASRNLNATNDRRASTNMSMSFAGTQGTGADNSFLLATASPPFHMQVGSFGSHVSSGFSCSPLSYSHVPDATICYSSGKPEPEDDEVVVTPVPLEDEVDERSCSTPVKKLGNIIDNYRSSTRVELCEEDEEAARCGTPAAAVRTDLLLSSSSLFQPLLSPEQSFSSSATKASAKFSRPKAEPWGRRTALFLFLLIGSSIIFPWSAFITAIDYFRLLYPSKSSSLPVWSGLVYNSPNLLLLFIQMVLLRGRLPLVMRVLLPLFIYLVTTAVTPFYGDFGLGEDMTFSLTLATVVLWGICASFLQGGMFGLAAQFPLSHTRALMIGNAMSGLIVGLLRIGTKLSFPDDRHGLREGTLLYFELCAVFMFVAIVAFVVLLYLPFTIKCRETVKLETLLTRASSPSYNKMKMKGKSTNKNAFTTPVSINNAMVLNTPSESSASSSFAAASVSAPRALFTPSASVNAPRVLIHARSTAMADDNAVEASVLSSTLTAKHEPTVPPAPTPAVPLSPTPAPASIPISAAAILSTPAASTTPSQIPRPFRVITPAASNSSSLQVWSLGTSFVAAPPPPYLASRAPTPLHTCATPRSRTPSHASATSETNAPPCVSSAPVIFKRPLAVPPPPQGTAELWVVLRKIWPVALAVFLMFLVSLSLFPGFVCNIENVDTDRISNDWFTLLLVTTFLTTDLLGRALSIVGSIACGRDRGTLLAALLRVAVFYPLAYACSGSGSSRWIRSDVYVVVLVFSLGLSNGYFSAVAVSLAPSFVEPSEKELAGFLMSTALVLGLLAGSSIAIPLNSAFVAPLQT